jgi:DNA-dependent protein kinase catalytic subunit
MLGQNAQHPAAALESTQKTLLSGLYARIIPAMLVLACDVELVARQLFEPLVMQTIHWFTNNRQYESEETVVLLTAILDGLCDLKSSSLRDFCAKCVAEFLKWSIKQSPQNTDSNPINVKSLLKRVYSLALHPSAFNRIGAALAVNNFYRVFREHNSLVDEFVIEMIFVFMNSLRFAHFDDPELGTHTLCVQAINHLQRMIVVQVGYIHSSCRCMSIMLP